MDCPQWHAACPVPPSTPSPTRQAPPAKPPLAKRHRPLNPPAKGHELAAIHAHGGHVVKS